MRNQKNILVSKLSTEFNKLILQLNKINPDKNFQLTIHEPNLFWAINWKTDRYLEECFCVRLYADNAKHSLIAEHQVKDVFEHINDEYFNYKEKSLEDFALITKEILQKTEIAIIESLNKDLNKGM
ncbi:hypothetical protein [uncultured Polaribacter sp.]|uniref:hypothetical protein n=1 Tax=uncultured Polaribacter sp. TaxID=174711 RepID=UPI002639FF32|nr:hypothetical protein [uncultured Polaribacter sp.]